MEREVIAQAPLRAGSLTLEPQTRAHAEALFALLADAALYEHEGEPPRSLDALRERLARLESRRSADGREHWLNWVVRDDVVGVVGYVQATVLPAGDALVAYVLGREHWGRGYASRAVDAMQDELARRYGAHTAWAIFRSANARSRRLLERLGYVTPPPGAEPPYALEADESALTRPLAVLRVSR